MGTLDTCGQLGGRLTRVGMNFLHSLALQFLVLGAIAKCSSLQQGNGYEAEEALPLRKLLSLTCNLSIGQAFRECDQLAQQSIPKKILMIQHLPPGDVKDAIIEEAMETGKNYMKIGYDHLNATPLENPSDWESAFKSQDLSQVVETERHKGILLARFHLRLGYQIIEEMSKANRFFESILAPKVLSRSNRSYSRPSLQALFS